MTSAVHIATPPHYDMYPIAHVAQSEVVTFIAKILESECGMRVRRHLESSVSQFFEHFDPQTRLFKALYRENHLRALLAVDHLNVEIAVLKWIFVASTDRNQGLGSDLIDQAISFAQKTGHTKLVLCTATRMEAAHRMYHKKGFVFKKNVTFWRKSMQILECPLNSGS